MDKFGNKRVPDSIPAVNPYATGKKRYGGGRTAPNVGPVRDVLGYAQRDSKLRAKKNAVLRRMKGQDTGNPMNSDYLRSKGGGGNA